MESITVAAAITEAEVYRKGCTITSKGEVQLVAGDNRIVIEGLPEGLDEASVSLKMPAFVTQGQVFVTREQKGPAGREEEVKELDARIDAIDRTISNKDLELASWKTLSAKMGGPAAIDFLDRLPAKLEELTSALADLRAERLKLSERRGELKTLQDQPRLVADVTCDRAIVAPFEVSCRSRFAGWGPMYDVLAEPSQSTVSLRMKAEVWQRTGHDWEDVALRLSTGTTTVLGVLPRFEPRHLSKVPPRPARPIAMARAGFAAPMVAASASADYELEASSSRSLGDTDFFGTLEEVESPEAAINESATATTYELAGPQSLANSDDAKVLTVATTTLAASFYDYAYPRLNAAAYLVARLESEPAPEVLARPLAVYLEGSYVGSVRLARSSDDDGYELPLGRDEFVRVQRNEDAKRSKSLLGGKVTVEHVCQTVIENRHKDVVNIVVVEQVPVSDDKEIEVAVRDVAGASHDEHRGELRWERAIAAGEKATFKAAYAVSHAKGVEVYEHEKRGASSGFDVPSGPTFCVSCGASLVGDERRCPTCGSPVW